MSINKELIIEILKREVVPALGCTEPVAVALCGAAAYKAIGGEVKKIKVMVSPNIYKNGMSVGIPGIEKVGLHVAAALGVTGGNPDLKLQVLSEVDENSKKECYKLIEEKKLSVEVENNMGNFFISCEVETENGVGLCHIKNNHSNIVLIKENDNVIYKNDEIAVSSASLNGKLKEHKLIEILQEIDDMSFEDLSFMMDGMEMNLNMAEIGLENNCGMKIGKNMKDYIDKGILSDDIYHNIVMMTAAASDARMSGFFKPVMSSAGSGNHGLTAIVPVAIAAKKLGKDDEKLVKALAISHMTTIYIKQYTGRLSSICGCGVAAGTGAAVAICYLLGGWEKEINYTIGNMIGDVTGMICDGAKPGCAIKLSTAAGAAIKSALLAVNESYVPVDNGVLGETIEDTILNLGKISTDGMKDMDKVILEIMVEKNKSMLC